MVGVDMLFAAFIAFMDAYILSYLPLGLFITAITHTAEKLIAKVLQDEFYAGCCPASSAAATVRCASRQRFGALQAS